MKTIMIGGIHAVKQALALAPTRVEKIFLDKKVPKQLKSLEDLAKSLNILSQKCDRAVLDIKVEGAHHQGVVAQLKEIDPILEADALERLQGAFNPVIVLLDEVQDPQNVGGILRSCAAFGANMLVVPERNSCKITASVRKTACGGDLIVPFLEVKNLARFIRGLQEIGIWIVGTSIDPSSLKLTRCDFKGPIALVMGAEGSGIRQNTAKQCDFLVRLPLSPNMESLNVSVATGICLYECWRQRQDNT
ncbi:MAG TPA: 23S rRNA (guanosine(2251)-2'-O)-methyltransferase RlmB [Gammaproteobacteria bacterium]|nr:23S rRNA (guanosine(2251)-2'-O)-methyltransferase RlmB [Gammaproteobacteria bacterium]